MADTCVKTTDASSLTQRPQTEPPDRPLVTFRQEAQRSLAKAGITGKTRLVINDELIDADIRQEDGTFAEFLPEDPVRNLLNAYWYDKVKTTQADRLVSVDIEQGRLKYDVARQGSKASDPLLGNDYKISIAEGTTTGTTPANNKENYYIDIKVDKSITGNERTQKLNQLTQLVENLRENEIKTNKKFLDYTFKAEIPFTQVEADRLNLDGSKSVVVKSSNFNYNYYLSRWESFLSNPSVPEHTLPNLYMMMYEIEKNPTDYFEAADLLILRLGQDVSKETTPIESFDPDKPQGKYKVTQPGAQPMNEYLSEWANKWFSLSKYHDKYDVLRNVCFTLDDKPLIDKYHDIGAVLGGVEGVRPRRSFFPMAVDIAFQTAESELATLLEAVNVDSYIINHAIESLAIGQGFTVNNLVEYEIYEAGAIDFEKQLNFASRAVWDITELLRKFFETDTSKLSKDFLYDPIKGTHKGDRIFIGDYMDRTKKLSNNRQTNYVFEAMLVLIFAAKLTQETNQNLRTFKDLIAGEPCASDEFIFQIQKFDEQGNLLQTFYMPNTATKEEIRYVDTQVKYNKEYRYVVSALQIVYGSEYEYLKAEFPSDRTNQAERQQAAQLYDARLFVKQVPKIFLVATPHFEFSGRVLDTPPLPPEIEVAPLRGQPEKLLFLFRPNTGTVYLKPEILDGSEQKMIDDQRRINGSYRVTKTNGTTISFELEDDFYDTSADRIKFFNDDPPQEFEIWRLEEKPESYQDFQDNFIRSVLANEKGDSAETYEILEFNKKYYYTFRAIDIHGNFSNPTPIYEIEIVNDEGFAFPLINIVEFEKKERQKKKPAKRFIQISPALNQRILDQSLFRNRTSAVNLLKRDIQFGVNTGSGKVWDKDFKLRLTSRSTGKKIDINFVFTHEHKKDK